MNARNFMGRNELYNVVIPEKDGVYRILHVKVEDKSYLRFTEFDSSRIVHYRDDLSSLVEEIGIKNYQSVKGRDALVLKDRIQLSKNGSVEFGEANCEELKKIIEKETNYKVLMPNY